MFVLSVSMCPVNYQFLPNIDIACACIPTEAIQDRDQRSYDSFFQIAGIHGLPFTEWAKAQPSLDGYKAGYCTHGQPLFPTWHRPYVALYEVRNFAPPIIRAHPSTLLSVLVFSKPSKALRSRLRRSSPSKRMLGLKQLGIYVSLTGTGASNLSLLKRW
jgi:hypothetical protein